MFDRYGAFHSITDNFVSFETGETMYINWNIRPEKRRFYPEYNVNLIATGDRHGVHFIHPVTGLHIPNSNLDFHGTQMVLVDCGSKKAVVLGSQRLDKITTPKHMAAARAWAYNEMSDVFSGATFTVNFPTKQTTEVKAWIKVARVTAKLMDNRGMNARAAATIDKSILDKYTPTEYIRLLAESSTEELNRAAVNGFALGRNREELQHLIVA
jgi:hypothetical protein